MVYFPKSKIEPPCLAVERTKKNGSYNCEGVVEQLKLDFHNKCYICEDTPQTLATEHFKPKSKYPDLKLDWENLFYVCATCNQRKSAEFDNILDCTKVKNIDELIRYDIKPFPNEIVKLSAINNDEITKKTVELLTLIYNSNPESTAIQKIQSANLRKSLIEEICKFGNDLKDYDDTLLEDYKDRTQAKIKGHLSNRSRFTAFKRLIIRENQHFLHLFRQYLE